MIDMKTVTVIGAGSLAHALVPALVEQGLEIKQVISKHLESADLLAKKVQAFPSDCICEIVYADLILLCIPDTDIEAVTQEISYYFEIEDVHPLFCHCSGSTSIDSLFPAQRRAVLYPLQTFSKNKKINWKEVPIFLEANQESDLQLLNELAHQLSTKVQILSSEKRQFVHLGAVFVSNFVNALAQMGTKIADNNNFPFEYYLPLMQEVIEKLQVMPASQAQTGPAIRKDEKTLNLHRQLIQNQIPELSEIYQVLTEFIQKRV